MNRSSQSICCEIYNKNIGLTGDQIQIILEHKDWRCDFYTTFPLCKHEAEMSDTSNSALSPVPCPCCSHPIMVPTLEQVIAHYKIAPQSARLLTAVWRGKGLPVSTERILDHMWAEDPEGGPPEARAYRYFQWSLWDLRSKLEGSGVGVVSAGYRAGYKLALDPSDRGPA